MQNILQFFIDSGPAGWLIVALGLISGFIIFERARFLFVRQKFNNEEFTLKIETLLLSGKTGDALTLCLSEDKKALPRVMKAVLERADREDKLIDQAHTIELGHVLPKLSEKLSYLSAFANISTLVGLLGTITGLIMSFRAVSFADPAQKQILLSQGISLAMNTTAMGLAVAIPVMLAYTVLQSRQNKMCDEIVNASSRIVDRLTNQHHDLVQNQKNENKSEKTELKLVVG